jgi:hypothetical protein
MDSTLVSGKAMIFGTNGATPIFAADCVMKDSGALEGGMGRSDVGPIAFQDPVRGDYRLAAGNGAIDYCDDTHARSRIPTSTARRAASKTRARTISVASTALPPLPQGGARLDRPTKDPPARSPGSDASPRVARRSTTTPR